jgi:hypothetical protein
VTAWRPEARSAEGRPRGWVTGGDCPPKFSELANAKSSILAHSDVKNYLLQTHQCSRKEKDLLQRSTSDPPLKLEPKISGA